MYAKHKHKGFPPGRSVQANKPVFAEEIQVSLKSLSGIFETSIRNPEKPRNSIPGDKLHGGRNAVNSNRHSIAS